jgi:hypothetical protein
MLSSKSLIMRKNLKCSKCSHAKVHKGKIVCTLFDFGVKKTYFAETEYVREREELCGPYAKYYDDDLSEE